MAMYVQLHSSQTQRRLACQTASLVASLMIVWSLSASTAAAITAVATDQGKKPAHPPLLLASLLNHYDHRR